MVPGLMAEEPPPPTGGFSFLLFPLGLSAAFIIAPRIPFVVHAQNQLLLFLDRFPPEITNPLNITLAAMIVYLSLPLLPSFSLTQDKEPPSDPSISYSWMPKQHQETVVWQKLTPLELRRFDGRDGGRVLLGIRGKIYDVSKGRGFYGPGGPYGNFAGRDASRGLAKQSFDDTVLTPVDAPIDDLADLTASEWSNLKDWEQHFLNKYFVCGDLIPNN